MRARHTAPYLKRQRTRLDKATAKLTSFTTFDALINAQGGFFPSIRIDVDASAVWLCDCYDSAQIHRKDRRRAHRYGNPDPHIYTTWSQL